MLKLVIHGDYWELFSNALQKVDVEDHGYCEGSGDSCDDDEACTPKRYQIQTIVVKE